MWKRTIFLAVLAVVASAQQVANPRAIVRIRDPNCPSDSGVEGVLTFTQLDGSVRVTGKVTGMPPGEYGYNVHEKGDLSGGCSTTGDHYNPDMKAHGHPHDEDRHVGDLGNLKFNSERVATVDFEDKLLMLTGERSIVGRAVVIHSMPDDYGKTEHPDSKVTGNSGKEVACGVIGWL